MLRPLIVLFTITFLISCSHKSDENISQAQPQVDAIKQNIDPQMDTISTDNFWILIDDAVQKSHGDNRIKEKYLIAELQKLSLDEIKSFEIALRKCLIDADDFKIMAAQKIIQDYVSDDTYLYFRCWLIGQGKTVYDETLKNPDYLATVINNGEESDWEALLYVATEAYSKNTGKKEDESFPRDHAIRMGLDYDFGAPATKGTDWKEEELPTLLPLLWKKFN